MIFTDLVNHADAENQFEKLAYDYGLQLLHWRTVPVNREAIGEKAKLREPLIRQVKFTKNKNKNKKTPNVNSFFRLYL
jgi:glutamate synthase domain-containing protein 1